MSRPAAPAGEPGRDTDAGPAPVSTAPEHRARPLHEFALTAVLMFAVVTIIRWVLDPASPSPLRTSIWPSSWWARWRGRFSSR